MDWYKIKVKDLIKKLEKFNPNWEVILNCSIDTTDYKRGENYVNTYDIQNYELDIYNYEYENDRTGELETSKDIVLNFNIF